MISTFKTHRETSSEREFSALHDARLFMCLKYIESSDSQAFLRTAILFERVKLFCETCKLICISTVPLDSPHQTASGTSKLWYINDEVFEFQWHISPSSCASFYGSCYFVVKEHGIAKGNLLWDLFLCRIIFSAKLKCLLHSTTRIRFAHIQRSLLLPVDLWCSFAVMKGNVRFRKNHVR